VRLCIVLCVSWCLAMGSYAQQTSDLVTKIQAELSDSVSRNEPQKNPKIPHGTLLTGTITDSKIYPGTVNGFQVYVPSQYQPDHPACLLVKLDGLSDYETDVLDTLIAEKEIPVVIGVGILPGTVGKTSGGRATRFNRSYEFDSMNDNFPNFVLNELLPAVTRLRTTDGRTIKISASGNDHAAMGASTGGIGSFTLAWRRPDQFSRVYSMIGTFVSMRGGNEYPALIRKTDPKPIRVFLEDGAQDAWNPLFGSWFDANLNMESALSFAGYDVAHAWGKHGHDSHPGEAILPDVLRWLWRDYPSPIKPGISQNSTLQEIALPSEGWQPIETQLKAITSLLVDPRGDVHALDAGGRASWTLTADAPRATKGDWDEMAYARGGLKGVAKHVRGGPILQTYEGNTYVGIPGVGASSAGRLWLIKKSGEKHVVDEDLMGIGALARSPDGKLLYVAEKSSKWIYSYVILPDGTLTDKQRFYWLQTADLPDDGGVQDLAVDRHGNLYAATPMGIQVCDQNGRVRAILPIPVASGAVRKLCFGGPQFDVLFATDGIHSFKRRLKVAGVPSWAVPVSVPSQGPG
jgi:gluconolactonase